VKKEGQKKQKNPSEKLVQKKEGSKVGLVFTRREMPNGRGGGAGKGEKAYFISDKRTGKHSIRAGETVAETSRQPLSQRGKGRGISAQVWCYRKKLPYEGGKLYGKRAGGRHRPLGTRKLGQEK